jgi:hypothetical protein
MLSLVVLELSTMLVFTPLPAQAGVWSGANSNGSIYDICLC